MLTAYAIVSRRLVQLQPEAGTDWLSRSSWIDLVAPSAAERDADDLEDAIDGLAEQEDLVGKVRLCLMDGQRDLKFLYRQRGFLPEQREWHHGDAGRYRNSASPQCLSL